MIAFDTNYLVRHIVQDDEEQCSIVASVLASEAQGERAIRILDLVMLETSWVLQAVYGFDRKAWVQIIEELLEDSAFSFDDPVAYAQSSRSTEKGKRTLPII